MTTEDLKNAIIDTEDEWMEDALPKNLGKDKKNNMRWLKPALITAACAVIAALGIMFWPRRSAQSIVQPSNESSQQAADEDLQQPSAGEMPSTEGSITKPSEGNVIHPSEANSNGQNIGNITPAVHAFSLAEAEYPAMTNAEGFYLKDPKDWYSLSYDEMVAMEKRQSDARAEDYQIFSTFRGSGESIKPFLQQAMALSLSGAGTDNALSAPLNLYMALAMLAETTAGETQQEILAAIGAESAEALREQAKKVWRANYYDNGYVKCVLGSSCWLSDSLIYKQNCVEALRDNYFASVYRGTMGSEEYDEAFRSWINAQTGNLLEESVSKLNLDPLTVIDLVSTFYFQDKWEAKFDPAKNTREIFHGAAGDTEAEFMHSTDWYGIYYYAENFGAYGKSLNDSGAVLYFILPDEGVDMEDLLKDPQLQAFLTSNKAAPYVSIKVNLSLPKFDIAQDQDLKNTVQQMGIQKVFEIKESDFSTLTDDTKACVSTVQQGARIIVDEEGVKAAAYVNLPVVGAPAPPEDQIDFVLDRPFLFVLRSRDDLPLLAGIVNQPLE